MSRKNKQGKFYQTLTPRLDAVYRDTLVDFMEQNAWNASKAALAAGVDRANFLRLIRIYGVKRPAAVLATGVA